LARKFDDSVDAEIGRLVDAAVDAAVDAEVDAATKAGVTEVGGAP